MRNITVREAKAEDVACIAEVVQEAFAPLRSTYRPTDQAVVSQSMRAQEQTQLVAVVEGRIVTPLELLGENESP